jgi:hypothetical protein
MPLARGRFARRLQASRPQAPLDVGLGALWTLDFGLLLLHRAKLGDSITDLIDSQRPTLGEHVAGACG